QTVRVAICPHGVDPVALDDRSGRWACPSLGHISPFAVLLFVGVDPNDFARRFVETMQALPGRGLDQLHIKDKNAPLNHHRTCPTAADGMSPADFQAFARE